jgi:hypothetical protein
VRWKIVRVEEDKAADLSWTVFPYAYRGSPKFKPGTKPAIGALLDFRNKRTVEIVTFSEGTDGTFALTSREDSLFTRGSNQDAS